MKPSSGPQLQIQLLGGTGARGADGTELDLRARGPVLLLARLAHPAGQAYRRDVLVEALFPDEAPEAGRARLRQYLYLLRQELESLAPGEAWLQAERETVRLAAGAVTTDVAEFQLRLERARRAGTAAERAERLQAALAVYRGEFLPGHFDDWSLAQRERLDELHANALCELSAVLVSLGEFPAALEHARQAVQVDRLREESHRALLRALAATGRAADAERHYRELERLLQEELGIPPSAATRHLRDEIRSSTTAPPPEAALAEHRPAPRVRLPQPLTRFYGRTEELARIERWLAGEATPGVSPAPLVTLTGPGGAGKTRLALEVAHRLEGWFGGAVWFVSLETVTDALGFLEAVAQALELSRTGEVDEEQLAERLRRQPTSLLVLDNFEQLVGTAALAVQGLRARVPGLACLVSSRQRLGVRGEQELTVSPLPVPRDPVPPHAEGGRTVVEVIQAFPSVQLFVDRAQAVRSGFQLTPENAAHVAAVCQRLDGLPLALELGAAWLAVLSPQQALDRLSQGLALLVSRDQDTPERHRSLQAALDSSYLLLSPEQQRLFRRLSAFRDGWTLEAAEAVCGDLAGGAGVLEELALLAERSLVLVEERHNGLRYRQLETMRHYAAAHAAEAGETELGLAAHAQYYHSFALAHRTEVHRAGREGGLDVVEADLENGRAALAWLSAREETHQQALELAAALGGFCWLRGRTAEGLALVERVLAVCAPDATPARLDASRAAVWLARLQPNDAKALQHLLEARNIATHLGDLRAVYSVAYSLAGVHLDQRDLEGAARWIEECEGVNRSLQDPMFTLLIEFRIGNWADLAGETGRARAALTRCAELAAEHRCPRHRGDALCGLGWTYRDEDPAQGARIVREGLKIHQEIGHAPMAMASLLYIGALELAAGQPVAATQSLREALRGGLETGQRGTMAAALAGIAAAEAAQEQGERAALLFGAAEALARSLGGLSCELGDLLELNAITSRRTHAAAEFATAWREGAALPLELVIPVAYGETGLDSTATAPLPLARS